MTIMSRSEVLESLRTYLMMMQHQVKQVGKAAKGTFNFDFYLRASKAFIKKRDLYLTLGVLTNDDYEDLHRLHQVIFDEMEVASRDHFPGKSPLFFTRNYRNSAKDAQGYPLQPVQLCNLLEQAIFKGLPALGDSRPVIEPVQDDDSDKSARSTCFLGYVGSIDRLDYSGFNLTPAFVRCFQ